MQLVALKILCFARKKNYSSLGTTIGNQKKKKKVKKYVWKGKISYLFPVILYSPDNIKDNSEPWVKKLLMHVFQH